MKTLLTVLIGSVSILLVACSGTDDMYDASGVFEATEIIVSSEMNGRILSFDIREGETLMSGQQAATIDSTQYFLQRNHLVQNRRAVLSRLPDIQTQLAVLEQQIATQMTEKQRIENLLRNNAATQKQLDDITAQIALLEKQLEAQRSSMTITANGIREEAATLEAQIQQTEDRLQKSIVFNPRKGTVLVKYAEEGELATPGKPLYKIADTEKMILRAYVTNSQLTQLKLGQDVNVYADFGEVTREYTGKLTWISSKSEFTPKTIQTKDERANLVYAIKISVQNDGFLKIGMYGQVRFNV